MDTDDRLCGARRCFDGKYDEASVHGRVQARGGGAMGVERSDADRGGSRVGDHADNAASLADGSAVPASPAAKPPVSPLASPADQASEIARLRRELERARMERDILKKAVGIHSTMLGTGFAEMLR